MRGGKLGVLKKIISRDWLLTVALLLLLDHHHSDCYLFNYIGQSKRDSPQFVFCIGRSHNGTSMIAGLVCKTRKNTVTGVSFSLGGAAMSSSTLVLACPHMPLFFVSCRNHFEPRGIEPK